jgi:adenylate cyclase class IV
MVNFGGKNLQKWDMIWGEIEVKACKEVSDSLQEKIRDKAFYNIMNQIENRVYFPILNNLKK